MSATATGGFGCYETRTIGRLIISLLPVAHSYMLFLIMTSRHNVSYILFILIAVIWLCEGCVKLVVVRC
jgi:hypothetical protein